MANRLAGKIALVTGAAQGIGEGIARMMVDESATVIFTDKVEQSVQSIAAEAKMPARPLDVTSAGDWAEAARFIEREFGRLDVLVNNAGIELRGSVGDMPAADWRKVMAVNLDSVFFGCQTLLPLLRVAGKARAAGSAVVNMSSIGGLVVIPNSAAYNTSKAGVRHLTKSLAIEWAQLDYNIRVNSIHPGAIKTPQLEADIAHSGLFPDGVDPWPAVDAMFPLKRHGNPADVAYAAVYLASDEAGFVTGAELVIDGGYVAR